MSAKIIRKITIGPDPKDGLYYIVGNRVFKGAFQITTIIEQDEGNVFCVYIKKDGVGELMWKKISGVPVVVDYDVDQYDTPE